MPEATRARYGQRFPEAPGTHPIVAENYYTRLNDLFHPVWGSRFDRIRTAIYDDHHKYIRSSDGQDELYDLRNDPGETSNLVDSIPALARRMREALAAFESQRRRTQPQPDTTPLSEEEKERLRALGYIGN
jgi:hypothetical protein